MVDCFRKTIKGEGFFGQSFKKQPLLKLLLRVAGLYKGAASPMAGAMAMNAALFFSYGQSKHIVTHFANKVCLCSRCCLLFLCFYLLLTVFVACCSRKTAS